jgi:peroxiredoxin
MKILRALLTAALFIALSLSPARALEEAPLVSPREGAEFPAFVLPDVDNRAVALSDFRGKAMMLSFWSCHSDTCYSSVRVIEALLKEYAPLGLVAPTICSEVPPAFEKNSYAGLLKHCSTGQVVLIDKDQELTKALGIKEFPTTYLIDRNYTVWKVIEGVRPLLEEEYRSLVRSLVLE